MATTDSPFPELARTLQIIQSKRRGPVALLRLFNSPSDEFWYEAVLKLKKQLESGRDYLTTSSHIHATANSPVRCGGIERLTVHEIIIKLAEDEMKYLRQALDSVRWRKETNPDFQDLSDADFLQCVIKDYALLANRRACPSHSDWDDWLYLLGYEDSQQGDLGPGRKATLRDRVQDALTPHQWRVAKFLWDREFATNWDTLATQCWDDRPSDDAVHRMLKRANERLILWKIFDVSIAISPAKKTAKLEVLHGDKAGQK